MRVIHFSDARKRLKHVIDEVVSNADATLIYQGNGKNAVLISEATYNSMMETMYLLSNPANAQRLMEAVAQDREGMATGHDLTARPSGAAPLTGINPFNLSAR